jgi:hypothetical protein
MAMDPGFFVQRPEAPVDLDVARARCALAAALETATAPVLRRGEAAEHGLRVLQDAYFGLPPHALAGLTFPVGPRAYLEILERRCETWLPYARSLGVADARLTLVGLATPACREIRARIG